jgi:isopentenyl phosphate kinase
MTTETVFLKLVGSLITDKDKPYTPSAKTGAWESREYCGVRGG